MTKKSSWLDSTVSDIVISILPDTIKSAEAEYKRTQIKLMSCFKQYVTHTHSKYSKIKTLLYRDKPVSLKDHYVAADFKTGEELINGENLLHTVKQSRKNIIMGTAGSGKSVLLRKMAIDSIESPCGFIPALIELRLVTAFGSDSIFDFLLNSISTQEEAFTKEQLHQALKLGKIALLLDGFDEIDYEKRDHFEKQIIELSEKYPLTIIVVSSRPDDCLSAWESFHIYNAMPLTQEQSIELVRKIDYDTTVKTKFISELKNGLYNKHNDFLSNPLLLTMMLLTYEQLAEIPEKIHIFYEQAFDTLYHKHDALKSLYKRKSYSSIPIDDFKKIFSAFCIITYSDRAMSFTQSEAIDYIQKSLEIENFEVKPSSIFNDLLKSVCIIQKDGNIYTFTHRSFQEYFAALFIARSQSEDIPKALDLITKESNTDNVIKLAFELNREKLETKWILPKIKRIIKKCNDHLDNKDYPGLLSMFFTSPIFDERGVLFSITSRKPSGFLLTTLHYLYSEDSDRIFGNSSRSQADKEKRKIEYQEAVIELTGREPSVTTRMQFSEIPKDSKLAIHFKTYSQNTGTLLTTILNSIEERYANKERALTNLLLKKKKKN